MNEKTGSSSKAPARSSATTRVSPLPARRTDVLDPDMAPRMSGCGTREQSLEPARDGMPQTSVPRLHQESRIHQACPAPTTSLTRSGPPIRCYSRTPTPRPGPVTLRGPRTNGPCRAVPERPYGIDNGSGQTLVRSSRFPSPSRAVLTPRCRTTPQPGIGGSQIGPHQHLRAGAFSGATDSCEPGSPLRRPAGECSRREEALLRSGARARECGGAGPRRRRRRVTAAGRSGVASD